MIEPIRFVATVYKVQTLVDGGIRVALDLPGNDETMIAMTELGACQIHGMVLTIVAEPQERKTEKIRD